MLMKHKKQVPMQKKEKQKVLLKLVDFSRELYHFKTFKDAFKNKRKGRTLEIIGKIALYYDVPDFIELCMDALKSKNKVLIIAAIEIFENYAYKRECSLPQAMIAQLDEIIESTKDRGVALSALSIQVNTGLIDEYEAVFRIDDWKDRNREN